MLSGLTNIYQRKFFELANGINFKIDRSESKINGVNNNNIINVNNKIIDKDKDKDK